MLGVGLCGLEWGDVRVCGMEVECVAMWGGGCGRAREASNVFWWVYPGRVVQWRGPPCADPCVDVDMLAVA